MSVSNKRFVINSNEVILVINSNRFESPKTNSYAQMKTQLTHLIPLVSFYTPWKQQKTFGFLMFSGGIEKVQWYKMG